ncbi:MAG: 4-(cytidine 5'-diphospho)-2-C-methyl-D-erythritol kinase [Xanthobacteraceae bacterium]
MSVPLVENAPAKVNLTLRVLGRRADGYHEIESLVAFADFGDTLSLSPAPDLTLDVRGPAAEQADSGSENLVLRAARALAATIPDLRVGAFQLDKILPVAAGLGGGSADAAAALRLLARANDLAGNDERLYEAARKIGADVSVCLETRCRLMRGIGEILGEPLDLAILPALLVNPCAALATKDVFAGWTPVAAPAMLAPLDVSVAGRAANREHLLQLLAAQTNDLELPAMALAPSIADVLVALRGLPGCRLARMSGSGATCFALFLAAPEAMAAAKIVGSRFPQWWVRATALRDGTTAAVH